MTSHIFVNLQSSNNSGSPRPVSVDETRDPQILSNPENYLVTIDRFSIHKAWLPVYHNAYSLKFKVTKLLDATYSVAQVDFTAFEDGNHLIWDKDTFVGALNAALENACTSVGLTGDLPSLSIDQAGICTLDYSGIADFATAYTISINEPLYSIMPTFEFTNVQFDQEYFKLTLPSAGDGTVSTHEKVNLSPVDKIYIKSPTIPLVYEFSPSDNASRQVEGILTDFEFGGANMNALTQINYTATSGQYRFHSMVAANKFDRIRLDFYYKTYNHTSFPLYCLPSGSVNIKLLFKPDFKKLSYEAAIGKK